MLIKDVISLLQKHDPEMELNLLDLSTDDQMDMNYDLNEDMFEKLEIYADEDDLTVTGYGLFIIFDNKLNPDPITEEE